jgi:hypothetical protein
MTVITANTQELCFCCGVDEIGDFELPTHANRWRDDLNADLYSVSSGTGYFISTFINNEACKRAYYELCDKAILLYQSPPRVNPRHGADEVFVCVFLSKDVK